MGRLRCALSALIGLVLLGVTLLVSTPRKVVTAAVGSKALPALAPDAKLAVNGTAPLEQGTVAGYLITRDVIDDGNCSYFHTNISNYVQGVDYFPVMSDEPTCISWDYSNAGLDDAVGYCAASLSDYIANEVDYWVEVEAVVEGGQDTMEIYAKVQGIGNVVGATQIIATEQWASASAGCGVRITRDGTASGHANLSWPGPMKVTVNSWPGWNYANCGTWVAQSSGQLCVNTQVEPVSPYCSDGIEALASSVELESSESWGATVGTGPDYMQVRYVIEAGSDWSGEGSINYATRTASGSVSGIYTTTVPAVNGVPGPVGDLTYENTGSSTFELLSACVITATQPDYCPTGIELITDTVTIDSGQSWSGETETGWDRFYTKFTFEYPDDENGLNYYEADMTVNDTTLERGWMRATAGDDDTHTELIPNLNDPTYDDFMDPAYESGPDVEVAVDATDNTDPLYLVSACVQEIPDTDWCEDGVELLDDAIGLGDLSINDGIQVSGTMTGTDVVARFVVEDPSYPSQQSGLAAQVTFITGLYGEYIQTHFVDYSSKLWQPMQFITATLPNTGTLSLFSSDLEVKYQNLQDPVILHSICIVGAEDLVVDPITAERCMLYNPDFSVDVGGANNWTADGSVVWDPGLDFDGIVTLSSMGSVTQTAQIEQGDVYEVEVKARSVEGTQQMVWGSPTTSLLTSGPQLYTATVEPLTAWWVVQRDIYLSGPNSGATSAVMAAGDGIEVDYICLSDDAGIWPEVECTLSAWSPPANEGILSGQFWNYALHHLREIGLYLLCELLRALNKLYTAIRDMLMVVPALPEDGSGLISWLEWIGLAIGRFGDYLGRNLLSVASWFPRNGETALRWLLRVLYEILEWFVGLFGLDAEWLAEMRDVIYTDGAVFLDAVVDEVKLEFAALMRLLEDTAGVFMILINGFASGVSGGEIAPIGRDMEGVGEFLWVGFDFFNTAIQSTPLLALNIVGLGILAFGLGQWTLQKLLSMLESLSL